MEAELNFCPACGHIEEAHLQSGCTAMLSEQVAPQYALQTCCKCGLKAPEVLMLLMMRGERGDVAPGNDREAELWNAGYAEAMRQVEER